MLYLLSRQVKELDHNTSAPPISSFREYVPETSIGQGDAIAENYGTTKRFTVMTAALGARAAPAFSIDDTRYSRLTRKDDKSVAEVLRFCYFLARTWSGSVWSLRTDRLLIRRLFDAPHPLCPRR